MIYYVEIELLQRGYVPMEAESKDEAVRKAEAAAEMMESKKANFSVVEAKALRAVEEIGEVA